MTINLADNSPRISYAVAQGATQTSFAVPFEFFADADLNVYVDETLKTLTTHYTVSGGDGSTGTVAISVTGATGGSTVVITRDVALERTTDFPSSGPFQIGALNTELDRLTAIAADLDDKAGRALQLTDFDVAASLVLPTVDNRKGKTLAFNASSGAVEAGPTISDVQTVSAAAADIATLADIEDGTDATNAIQTVAGISSNVTTVAGVSTNVTTVAGISANVTAVANDESDIGTVAANIADVNTAATNITEIQNASTNAATATTKASEASTSASNAATSETNAATSATTATTKAGEAATSASNAATSETNAATSATNAATSASAAAASQTAAAASAASAASSYDSFDDRYLGVKSSDPTLDNDSNALVAGALYFSSTSNTMQVYDGASWIAATSAGNVSLLLYEYTATSGQTTFSGADDNAATLSYTVNNIQVVMNGVILDPSDYTATSGTSVVLASGAATGDTVNIYAFKSFTTADMVPASTGGTFSGNVTFAGAFTSQGIDDNATSTAMTLDSSGNLLVGQSTTTVPGVGNTTAGVSIRGDDGSFFSRSLGSGDTNSVVTINRSSHDGNILGFNVDGTFAGNIGVYSSDNLYIQGKSDHSGLAFGEAEIYGFRGGSENDGVTSLGSAAGRFNNLYLSGGVYLGGTGAANKLDDYEEGTWTPTSGNSGTLTFTRAYYTKIGNKVTLQIENLILSDTTSSTSIAITSLPFASGVVSATGPVMVSFRDNTDAITAFIPQGVNEIRFYLNSGTTSFQRMQHNMFNNSSGSIYMTITYFTT